MYHWGAGFPSSGRAPKVVEVEPRMAFVPVQHQSGSHMFGREGFGGGGQSMGNVIELTSDAEYESLINRPVLTIIEYKLHSCPACKSAAGDFIKLSQLYPGVSFAKVEATPQGMIPTYGPNAGLPTVVPTFDIYFKGKRIHRISGKRFDEIEQILNEYGQISSGYQERQSRPSGFY